MQVGDWQRVWWLVTNSGADRGRGGFGNRALLKEVCQAELLQAGSCNNTVLSVSWTGPAVLRDLKWWSWQLMWQCRLAHGCATVHPISCLCTVPTRTACV